MSFREQIGSTFDGMAFKRPLFYSYGGGLRFELSEGGHYLNQFLTAHRKGMEICSRIFSAGEPITICVQIFGGKSLLSCLSTIRALSELGLYPDGDKEHWAETDADWAGDDSYADNLWHYMAYELPSERLLNALWCAFSSDFGTIAPRAHASIYLFNLKEQIMVNPYDDRGMDIVGTNKPLLTRLYNEFNTYLLEYDREAMDATFSSKL